MDAKKCFRKFGKSHHKKWVCRKHRNVRFFNFGDVAPFVPPLQPPTFDICLTNDLLSIQWIHLSNPGVELVAQIIYVFHFFTFKVASIQGIKKRVHKPGIRKVAKIQHDLVKDFQNLSLSKKKVALDLVHRYLFFSQLLFINQDLHSPLI